MSPRFRVSFVGSVSSQRIIAVFCNVNLELEFEFHGNILAVDIGKFASEQTGGWGGGEICQQISKWIDREIRGSGRRKIMRIVAWRQDRSRLQYFPFPRDICTTRQREPF